LSHKYLTFDTNERTRITTTYDINNVENYAPDKQKNIFNIYADDFNICINFKVGMLKKYYTKKSDI